jgi:hypothetical protein
LPTFTPLPTETQNQIPPTDIPAPTNTAEPIETIALAQDPYPEPQVTTAAPTSLPAYPDPPESVPDDEQKMITPTLTSTLAPAYITPSEEPATESVLDQIYVAFANVRYPLLCVIWLFCGGTIAILLLGWVVILIRMRRQ